MQTNVEQLDGGLMYITSWTPPYRAENLRKLLKRVKRVADKRGIHFESNINKPTLESCRKSEPGAFLDYKTSNYHRYICLFEITHGPLSDSGWFPLAVIEPMLPGKVDSPVIINRMPSTKIEDETALLAAVPDVWDSYCGHCGTNRRRKQCVLVQSETTGEIKQVGSNCLFDFTGIDPELLSRLYSYYGTGTTTTERDYESWVNGWTPGKEYPLFDFLVVLGRWLGVKNQYVKGAGQVVFNSYLSLDGTQLISKSVDLQGKPYWVHSLADETVGHLFAEDALNMLSMLKPKSSFDYNLDNVFKFGIVVKKTAGYAGAIWTKWFNLMGKGVLDELFGRNKPEESSEPHPSQHLGELGERIEFTCDVLFTKTMGDGMWGPTTLVTMQDDNENQIITWTTGKVPRSGSKIMARGTVKKHKEYKDVKQTQVGRLWFKVVAE